MARNVQPYLELIGYGHLKEKMGGMFLIASLWCDELEKMIDNCANKHLDTWVTQHVSLSVPFETYYQGLLQLQTLSIPLPIQYKAADLIFAFKQTKVNTTEEYGKRKCNTVSV